MNIIHDPKQLLKDIDLSKITDEICLEEDENIREFLEDNKYLINYSKLAKNKSKWSFEMCCNYLYDNNNYIKNNSNYKDIISMLLDYNQDKFMNNNILVNKLINFVKDDINFISCNYLYFYNEEIYNITLNRIKKNNFDIENYKYNINYILRYCDLKTYLELCKLDKELDIINLENIILNCDFLPDYNNILKNENNDVIDYVIKYYEENIKNKKENYINKKFSDSDIHLEYNFLIKRFIFNFLSNKSNKAINYIINNNLITNEITKSSVNMMSMLLNDSDIMVKYIIDNKLINEDNYIFFKNNKNPIAIEYCKNFKLD